MPEVIVILPRVAPRTEASPDEGHHRAVVKNAGVEAGFGDGLDHRTPKTDKIKGGVLFSDR